jgi:hypothetical protein
MEGIMADVVELQRPEQAPRPAAVGFFEEDSGNRSAMRLMSMLALLTAIAFGAINLLAAIGLLGSNGGGDAITITFGFLIAAFAPKAVQKFAETKLRALNSAKRAARSCAPPHHQSLVELSRHRGPERPKQRQQRGRRLRVEPARVAGSACYTQRIGRGRHQPNYAGGIDAPLS